MEQHVDVVNFFGRVVTRVSTGRIAKDIVAQLPGFNIALVPPNKVPDTVLFVHNQDFSSHDACVHNIVHLQWAILDGYRLCKQSLIAACKCGILDTVNYLVHEECPID